MQTTVTEKEILLDSIEEIIEFDRSVSITFFISVIASIFIALFLFLPKIYLANSLYSASVQIEEMKTEYLSLKNENEILKSKIALLKFKNGVTH
jgi:cell division protein FtsB